MSIQRPIPPDLRHALGHRANSGGEDESMALSLERHQKSMAAFCIDPIGRISTWNRVAERVLGCKAGEAIGSHLSCCFANESRERIDGLLNLVRESGEAQSIVAKGQPDAAGSNILMSCVPIEGETKGWLQVIVADRTEQLAVEQDLHDREELYAIISQTLPYGAWLCDPEGRALYLSDSFLKILGHRLEELSESPRPWLDRVHPDDLQQVLSFWKSGCHTGNDWQCEYRLWGVDNQWHDILTQGRPFRDKQGKIRSWAGIHLDISKRKQLERQLSVLNNRLEERVAERTRQLNRRALQLRRLVNELTRAEERERERMGRVLHDSLQQTLTAAIMRAHVLRKTTNPSTREEVGDELGLLLREAVDETRSLSAELRPYPLRENSLAEALHWLATFMHDRHKLRVVLELNTMRDPTDYDIKYQVFEIVRELLFNVVKHAGIDTATLRSTENDSFIHLVVSDEGAGMDPKSLEGDTPAGTGLCSARDRLALLGGNLVVESTPGQGCRIHVHAPAMVGAEIPVETGEITLEPSPAAVREDGRRTGKISVVLADDHEIVRAGLAGLLQMEEDLVVLGEAADGVHLLELVSTLDPEVAIIDINMPKLNGVEATRQLKQAHPTLYVIGLSVSDDPLIRQAMREAGASSFFTKGSDFSHLREAIQSARH